MSEILSYLDIEVNFVSFVFLIRYSRTRNSQHCYRKLFLRFGSKFSRRSSRFVAFFTRKKSWKIVYLFVTSGQLYLKYFSSLLFIIIITILVICQEKIMEDRTFVYSGRVLFLNILVADFKNSLLYRVIIATWNDRYLQGIHLWFWFFSLLAGFVACLHECVSTFVAVCKQIKQIFKTSSIARRSLHEFLLIFLVTQQLPISNVLSDSNTLYKMILGKKIIRRTFITLRVKRPSIY